ncbi:hypothetical protein H6794_02190 [Candidatus Nomurabacteria bacterium]|nr:hypothetical protein [Candidatus Saccharibacteria bacterium]MCB9839641.1 hypothetical protein [Candidatus Nomurabacteria bacterium]
MQPDTPKEPKVLSDFPTPYEDLDAIIQNTSTNMASDIINKDLEETSNT